MVGEGVGLSLGRGAILIQGADMRSVDENSSLALEVICTE